MRSLAHAESAVMLGCIAAGAVVGFSLVGSAAAGTTLGAAVGIAVVAVARRRSTAGSR